MEPTQQDIRQLNESLKELTRQLATNNRQETAAATLTREMVETNKRLATQLIKTNELLVKLIIAKDSAPVYQRRF